MSPAFSRGAPSCGPASRGPAFAPGPRGGEPSDALGASKPAPETGDLPGATGPYAPGLYVLATPLGNLADISARARQVLGRARVIACEDTRVTRRLLSALAIPAPRLVRYDDHAGDSRGRAGDGRARAASRTIERLIQHVRDGAIVALVADAGTPLIADPGYRLVAAARAAGIRVVAIPGPSAAIAALSIAGLPCDRFLVVGFLPAKAGARGRALLELAGVPATLVLFESPHRLAASLAHMAQILGPRPAAVARELTKLFEEVRRGPLDELARHYGAEVTKGEIVIVIAPPAKRAGAGAGASGAPALGIPALGAPTLGIGVDPSVAADLDRRLDAALRHASLSEAAREVAAATGQKRREVYARALARRAQGPHAQGPHAKNRDER